MGLASSLHPRAVFRASRDALSRTWQQFSYQGTDGRLPCGLCNAVWLARAKRRIGRPALEGRWPLRHERRKPALRIRERSGGHGKLPDAAYARIRSRTRSWNCPDPLACVSETVTTAGGRCPGCWGGELGRRYRDRGCTHSSYLVIGEGIWTHPLANRRVPRSKLSRAAGAVRGTPRPLGEHAHREKTAAATAAASCSVGPCQTSGTA